MKTCFSLLIILLLFSTNNFAQDTIQPSSISYSGYIDGYIAYYRDSVGIDNYQKYPSISPGSKQIGLNVVSFTAKYSSENVRGLFTLHYGDIPESAWSSNFNFIQEANAGIRLSSKLWLDAGFFRTHVGTEGLFPKENITSSVAVCTFNEPYFESGFRLNYNPGEKLAISLFLLNGYNIYIDNNSEKSIGALLVYSLGDKGSIGYNNYIGDDSPESDSLAHIRFYHNLFINYQLGKIKIQVGGDYAVQQNSNLQKLTKMASMYGGVASAKYQVVESFALYCRGEIFNDPQGFISGIFKDDKNNMTGLKLWGFTAGIEYKPTENSYIRMEGRKLKADDAQYVFHWNNKNTNNRLETMIHVGISF